MYRVKIKKACMECGGTYQEGGSSKENMKVNSHMGPVKREEANIEVEKGESAFGDINGDSYAELMFFGGKRHHSGGTPVSVPPGTFIFSDTKKLKIKDPELLEKFFNIKNPKKGGYTPAEISNQYKDFNTYLDTLKNPDSDNVSIATAYEMVGNITNKLGALALIQEAMKGFPDGVPSFAESAMGALGLSPEELGQAMQPDEEQGEMNQGPVEEMQEGEFKFGGLHKYQKGGLPKKNVNPSQEPNGFINPFNLSNLTDIFTKGAEQYASNIVNNTKKVYNSLPNFKDTVKEITDKLSDNSLPAKHRKELYDKLPDNVKNLIDKLPDDNSPARNRATFAKGLSEYWDNFKRMEKYMNTPEPESKQVAKNEVVKTEKKMAPVKKQPVQDPDFIKYYKETHKGQSPKYFKSQGIDTNEEYQDLIKGLAKSKEKTIHGDELELGEKGAKKFFNDYIDAYESGDIKKMSDFQSKLEEIDIPGSVGWMWGSNQDQLDIMSTALDTRINEKYTEAKSQTKKLEGNLAKLKYENYLKLLELDYKNEVDVDRKKDLENQIKVVKQNLKKPLYKGQDVGSANSSVSLGVLPGSTATEDGTFKDLIPSNFNETFKTYFDNFTRNYKLTSESTDPAKAITDDPTVVDYKDGFFNVNNLQKAIISKKNPITTKPDDNSGAATIIQSDVDTQTDTTKYPKIWTKSGITEKEYNDLFKKYGDSPEIEELDKFIDQGLIEQL